MSCRGKRVERRLVARTLVVFLATSWCLGLSAAAPDFIPIAEARTRAANSEVVVLGMVTVPSGRFQSSTDDNGFAIQDQTGGIWVSTRENLRLRLNQHVWVRGTLGVAAGKLQIVAETKNVKLVAANELRVATGRVGAATSGLLITVEGVIESVRSDLPYGHKIVIDDGTGPLQIFVSESTGIDVDTFYMKRGRSIRVTGFSSQYNVTWEVEPRTVLDIRPAHSR